MNLTVWWCCATFIHFTLVFTESSKRLIRSLMNVYYPLAFFGALYESTRALPEKASWGYTYAIDPNPWISNLVFLYFTSINIIPTYLIIRYYLKQEQGSRKRTQVRWFLLGVALPIGVSLFELISIFVVDHRVPEFTTLSMSWLAGIIVYGSWRYELFLISPEKAADRIIEMIADALVMTNLEGEILFINASTQRLLGYDEFSLIGEPLSSVFVDRCEVESMLRGDLSGELNHRESKFLTVAKTEIMVQYSISVLSKGSEKLGLVLTFHDISQRKENENRIKRLNHQLSEKNVEMEQMIYMVTHDLRSPLMNISGITELMTIGVSEVSGRLEALEQSEYVDDVKSLIQEELYEPLDDLGVTTRKMTNLVDSLLEVARLTNKIPERHSIDMNHLVKSVFKLNAYRIQTAGIKTEVDALPECIGDQALIDQIFSNLIDNAIKYIDPSRESMIKVYSVESETEWIYAVKDNGLGIPKEHFDSIFRSFSQVDQQSSGYGIGLSTIAKLVHKQGGRIWLDSQRGEGTTFFVSFPVS